MKFSCFNIFSILLVSSSLVAQETDVDLAHRHIIKRVEEKILTHIVSGPYEGRPENIVWKGHRFAGHNYYERSQQIWREQLGKFISDPTRLDLLTQQHALELPGRIKRFKYLQAMTKKATSQPEKGHWTLASERVELVLANEIDIELLYQFNIDRSVFAQEVFETFQREIDHQGSRLSDNDKSLLYARFASFQGLGPHTHFSRLIYLTFPLDGLLATKLMDEMSKRILDLGTVEGLEAILMNSLLTNRLGGRYKALHSTEAQETIAQIISSSHQENFHAAINKLSNTITGPRFDWNNTIYAKFPEVNPLSEVKNFLGHLKDQIFNVESSCKDMIKNFR